MKRLSRRQFQKVVDGMKPGESIYINAINCTMGTISEYKKNLEDIFFYCDMIDLQIERDKIEGRYEV